MKHVPFAAGACLALASLWTSAVAQSWELQPSPLLSDWAHLVDTNAPLPEYPRPQMVRAEWMNLNGIWQFKPGVTNEAAPFGQPLPRRILVPFPMESALSGIGEYHAHAWYRRTFEVPPAWSGKRVLLHFGAVDWESEVFVNGQSLGVHKGGYDPFKYDLTPHLTGSGPQELIVRIYDPTDAAGVPRGKQTLSPGGIMYTSSSGIWQTVWLEPVAASSVSELKLIPDVPAEKLRTMVTVSGPTNGLVVHARAFAGNTLVGTISGAPGAELLLPVPNPNLWSPTNPFLYDLQITLSNAVTQVDSVSSYFGMRKVGIGMQGGYLKMLLNDQFVFHYGPLDQGFWPDGLYTAPTDDALKSDIEQTKLLGFNMIRKHIKVEPARWYYWADKLGVLVWQDMPSLNSYTGNPKPIDAPQFQLELQRMVRNLWNHPSIVMWVVFNEGQGQHDTVALVNEVKTMDPSRMVNQASGGSFEGAGDILDFHSYPNPSCPSSSSMAVVCGEFGGVGLGITNHTWAPGWGYIAVTNGAELVLKMEDFGFQLAGFVQGQGLSGAVYTEITDVEIELNGFLTYDRKVRKANADHLRAAILMASTPYSYTTVVPTSQTVGQSWRYTTATPPSNWYATDFDAGSWTNALGGFGAGNPPNTEGLIRTTWNTSNIWLRRSFVPTNLTAETLTNLFFLVYHDEAVEIYINGVLAGTATGYSTTYKLISLTPAGRAAIVTNGANTLAVHCNQTGGGQYIDVGLVVRTGSSVVPPRPVPVSPINVVATAGPGRVSLGWTASAEALNYRVHRSFVSGGPYALVAETPVNSGSDMTVTNGGTYFYVISAFNASGESVNSFEVSVTVPQAPAPEPPVPTAWFRADSLVGLTNDAPVGLWPDYAGEFDASQANADRRPRYVTGAINGLPAVRFSSSSQTHLSLSRPIKNDFTILCVFRSSQGVGTGTQFYQGAGLISGEMGGVRNDFGLSLNSNGRILAGTGNPDVTAVSNSGFDNGQPQIVTFQRAQATGNVRLYVNGVLQASVTGSQQSLIAPDQLTIGTHPTLVNFFSGDIAEFKIYDAVLTGAERVAEENALRCKYGLGAGTPPEAPQSFSATAANRKALLEWAPSMGAERYQLFHSLDGQNFVSAISNITSLSVIDTNAVSGRTNFYRLTAAGPCGVSVSAAEAALFVPLPALSVGVAENAMVLAWPSWATDWVLRSTTNLTPPITWFMVTNQPGSNESQLHVTLPLRYESEFFRLSYP